MKFPYKIIDLTHILDHSIPTWNARCGFNHDMHIDYSDCVGKDKFRVMKIKMHSGIGTHIDAPSHCIAGGREVHDLDVNDLCMPCIIIDVSHKCYERYSLTVEDVMDFENKYGNVAKGSCVIVRTGWEKFWNKPEKYHNNHVFPSISIEAANFLLKREVNALGIDTLSPDRPEDGFKVHQAFLGANKILIENVANSHNMPPTDGFAMILPMKIKNGTEAPARLVGLVKHLV